MMAGDRGHWPKGEECKEAIAMLANAMQTVVGWIQTMSDDELEHLEQTLARWSRVIAVERTRRAGAPPPEPTSGRFEILEKKARRG